MSNNKRKYMNGVLSVIPKLYKSYTVAVNASQTFEELAGESLPDDVYAVEVYLQDGNILYIQNGEASTSSGGIQRYDSLVIAGSKDELDLYELYTGDATDNNVTLFVWTL